ncbi:MAG TPA: hypothetical protein VGN92_04090, partial [Mycobacterium sp.]|nr:hypothetical protein [Mycobacterium sp.]
MKSVAMSVAALAVIGGAAVGIASVAAPVTQVQLAAVGAPLPQEPPPPPAPAPVGPGLPTAEQLT